MIRRTRFPTWPLRMAASTALLLLLLQRVDFGSMLPRHPDESTLFYVVAGLFVTGLGFVLSAWRWQRVLVVLGIPVRIGSLLSHQLAGQFVGNFLPSTIGGDVLRVYRLANSTGSAETSFASVLLERLSGWIVLPFFILLGLATQPALYALGSAPRLALVLAGGTLVLFAVLIAVAGSRRLGGRLSERRSVARFMRALHLGIDRLGREPAGIANVFAAAAVYQLTTVLTVFMAIRAVDVDVSFGWAFAFAPAVAIAQVLPLSMNGLGLREAALAIFLAPLGVSAGQAIAAGLLIHTITLLASLAGAPAFAFGAQSRVRAV